jgi:L-amino acid N-acyltransferase YncA
MILRAATPDDAASLSDLYAPYVRGSAVSFEVEPPDTAEMRRRIESGGDLYPWLVAEAGGTILGYAYAAAFRSRAAYRFAVETTVYARLEAQGRGVGTRLYGALLAGLAAQGFTQAIGAITLPNPASVALHEKLGFRRSGTYAEVGWKLGRWHDVGLWQRPLGAGAKAPTEPLGLAAAGWQERFLA